MPEVRSADLLVCVHAAGASRADLTHRTGGYGLPNFGESRIIGLEIARLRAAGVTEEDRKALLGHKNGSITSHYSRAELEQLIKATNVVSATDSRGPVLTILKRRQA